MQHISGEIIDMLAGLGYTVLKANDAQQALAVIGSGVHVDLMFTDVVMPGPVRSPEMARQATRLLPHLKVLFTSGYTQNAIVHGGRLDQGVELLSKPYSREQLAYKIREMLGPGDSEPAEGIEEPVQQSSGNVAVSPLERRRILVVDDDTDSLEAVCELLTMLGHTPVRADNPHLALETLRTQPFDILLTDLALPGMSGKELARRALNLNTEIGVIFASGNTLAEDEKLGFEWTALHKPFDTDQLLDAIQKASGRSSPERGE